EREALAERGRGVVEASERKLRAAEIVQGDGEGVLLPELALELRRLLRVGGGRLRVVSLTCDRAQVRQDHPEPALVARLARKRGSLFVEPDRAVEVAFAHRDVAKRADTAADLALVSDLTEQRECFLRDLRGAGEIALAIRDGAAVDSGDRARLPAG